LAKVQMTAAGPLPYDGKQLRAGEHFEATDRDAKILVATRKATYRTRHMTADDYASKEMRPRGNGSSDTLHLPKRDQQKRRGA
jgi:hypothetical protein